MLGGDEGQAFDGGLVLGDLRANLLVHDLLLADTILDHFLSILLLHVELTAGRGVELGSLSLPSLLDDILSAE